MSQPLILTLEIDASAQAFYEELRRRHFPPERNLIPAHLSLFHQLPDEEPTFEAVGEMAAATPVIRLGPGTPRSIGRGVAVFFESEELASLHARLSRVFQAHLIPQDRQRFRPHIVAQNKVDPETARDTLSQLQASSLVEPHGIGLTLWRYLGGPWERLGDLPFGGAVQPGVDVQSGLREL